MGQPTAHGLGLARSFLFVPGNRPERFDKAVVSGADVVVLDLEDAVPLPEKPAARAAIASAWPRLVDSGVPVVLRVNSPRVDAGVEDMRWATRLGIRGGLMVPKVESASTLAAVSAVLPGIGLLPLIESAAGYMALTEIAKASGVVRLVLGHIDFMADTGMRCSADEPELAPLRFAMAMETCRAGLATVIEGVTIDFRDDELLRRDTRRGLRFGFGAKLCIHPCQVAAVHDVFAPDPGQITWARRVVDADMAAAGRVAQLDGKMVDRPVVLQARRLLEQASAMRRDASHDEQ